MKNQYIFSIYANYLLIDVTKEVMKGFEKIEVSYSLVCTLNQAKSNDVFYINY